MRTILAFSLLLPAIALAGAPPATPGPSASPSFMTYRPGAIADHPEWDAEYTRQIREDSTGVQFMTDLVDHLPASATVPTPLSHHGYIAGAPDHLTYAADVAAYMRALAAASPRVKVFSLGRSEEGREMILVAVADETTIADLDHYREITRKLADPRGLSDDDAQALIAEGKPIYWLTGGLHSPETGSPEMLMELAYRLAVEDTPMVRSIRDHIITLITPVLEVDGRERMVDLSRWAAANPDAGFPPFAYWGHYVAHDNNRDAVGLALALSRNIERAYLDWRPQVMHDLHESIPFLYVSSGTGPYNAWLDPLMVDQWERMAYNEVQTLTAKGLPGVWTHGFYDGWAPNYLFWVAMGHNSLGRFYETFGNHLPTTETRTVRGMSDRAWFRPNPPLPEVRWSLRNNVNFQESGVLVALSSMATDPQHFLQLFWDLGKRSVAKATTEGPAAYVFTAEQPRQGQLHDLLVLFAEHGIEASVTDAPINVKRVWPPKADEGKDAPAPATSPKPDRSHKSETPDKALTGATSPPQTWQFPTGSIVIRMDQPASRLADALLDTQYVRGEERVYDDTGWTVGYARNLEWARVVNPAVLATPMHRWTPSASAPELPANTVAVAVANRADTDIARLRWALPDVAMRLTDAALAGKEDWPAGSLLLTVDAANRDRIAAELAKLHLRIRPLTATPNVASHDLLLPRVALLHTWTSTQDEGWYRLAFEQLGIPYEYISTQDVAAATDLRSRYDVIVFPPVGRSSSQDIVNGLPPGPPLPWRASELTPNLGRVDSTDDMRPGLGLAGVEHLTSFVASGGLLIAVQDAAQFAIDYGLARYVEVVDREGVKAPGTQIRAEVVDPSSPVVTGYDATVPVYFDGGPVFRVGVFNERNREGQRPSGRGSVTDPDVPQGRPFVAPPERPKPGPGEEGFQLPEDLTFFYRPYLPRPEDRPRVVLAVAKKSADVLLSGMLEGAGKIAGKALVVDAPLGSGHVLLIGCNPMWRSTTEGDYALVTNALMNWSRLGSGWPPAAAAAAK